MEELKPCPFCGRSASVIRKFPDVTDSGNFVEEYGVRCSSCGATIGRDYRGEYFRENGEFFIVQDGYSDAVAAWNTRAGDA